MPDKVTAQGSGTTHTVKGLPAGSYTFTVTNSSGCTSSESSVVNITAPAKPVVKITDPPPACYPATVDLTAPAVTKGSTPGLTYTYWLNSDATFPYSTPSAASEGTYYIKGATESGFFDIEPVTVKVVYIPKSDAGPDQVLPVQDKTTMAASLDIGESGYWLIEKGQGVFADTTDPNTSITNLSDGTNILAWIVNNGACPADTDNVQITVGELIIPTLITPNGDSKNEYFVINGLESLGKAELYIFDRRGFEVFRNTDYDNKWNGVDNNENQLPIDTYFYLLKTASGQSYSGYIVIRR
jgi:gliding motility-associated-like protein